MEQFLKKSLEKARKVFEDLRCASLENGTLEIVEKIRIKSVKIVIVP